MDRETDVPPACYSAAKLTLSPVDPLPVSRQFNAILTSAGSFTLRDVPAARYRIEIKGIDGPCFLKEIQVDGKHPDRTVTVDGNLSLAGHGYRSERTEPHSKPGNSRARGRPDA